MSSCLRQNQGMPCDDPLAEAKQYHKVLGLAKAWSSMEFPVPDMEVSCRMLQTARNPDDIRWLPRARMNIVASALSMRDPDAPGLIWATEEAPDALHTLSLGELRREALRFSAALRKAGFSPGEADVELCRPA